METQITAHHETDESKENSEDSLDRDEENQMNIVTEQDQM